MCFSIPGDDGKSLLMFLERFQHAKRHADDLCLFTERGWSAAWIPTLRWHKKLAHKMAQLIEVCSTASLCTYTLQPKVLSGRHRSLDIRSLIK